MLDLIFSLVLQAVEMDEFPELLPFFLFLMNICMGIFGCLFSSSSLFYLLNLIFNVFFN